jgi:osmotically inducible protein OsmC
MEVMIERKAEVVWQGGFKDGKGKMKLGSGAYVGSYSVGSRFEDGIGTNPEELIGAAHAGCFSMAFTMVLEKAGYRPNKIETDAKVNLVKQDQGFKIETIDLHTRVDLVDIENDEFQKLAEQAKENCPVSKALTGVQINLKAESIAMKV